MSKLTVFEYNGRSLSVNFLQSQQVKDGVICDIYEFTDDSLCDLGIINVKSGATTPKQKILTGDKTIEGFIAGKGTLKATKQDGEIIEYNFPGSANEVELHAGDIMQWFAETDLSFYEICYPAYSDGRFQNLD